MAGKRTEAVLPTKPNLILYIHSRSGTRIQRKEHWWYEDKERKSVVANICRRYSVISKKQGGDGGHG